MKTVEIAGRPYPAHSLLRGPGDHWTAALLLTESTAEKERPFVLVERWDDQSFHVYGWSDNHWTTIDEDAIPAWIRAEVLAVQDEGQEPSGAESDG